METESNYYYLVELPIDPPTRDREVIDSAITKKLSEWNQRLNDPGRGLLFKSYADRIGDIRTALHDPMTLERFIEEATARVRDAVTNEFEAIAVSGYVTEAQITEICKRHPQLSEATVRKMCPVQIRGGGAFKIPKKPPERGIKPLSLMEMDGYEKFLTVLGKRDVYDFLNATRYGSGEELSDLAAHALAQLHKAPRKTPEVSASQELAGKINTAFKKQGYKDSYDEALKTYAAKKKLLAKFALRCASRTIEYQAYQHSVKECEEIGMAHDEAEYFVYEYYCITRKCPTPIVIESGGENPPPRWNRDPKPDALPEGTVKCPQCGSVVSVEFPYCEHCTFPIGEMLRRSSDPNYVKNELKRRQHRRPLSGGGGGGFSLSALPRGVVVGAVSSAAVCACIAIAVLLPHDKSQRKDVGVEPTRVERPSEGYVKESGYASAGGGIVTDTDDEVKVADEAKTVVESPAPPAVVWVHPKEWYDQECEKALSNVRALSSGGYRFDRNLATQVAQKIKQLRTAISDDDANTCERVHGEMIGLYREFSDGCVWEQGRRHAQFPHIVSSYQKGRWDAEPGYEFVNPGTSDLTVREKPQQWVHPREWYQRECNVISQNVRNTMSGPYSYNSSAANTVLKKANSLLSSLGNGKPDAIERMCADLQSSYREFQSTCQWRAGVRHPQIQHVYSSSQPNTWAAEKGWEFVNPGTSDLSVRKAKVACTCTRCKGNGVLLTNARCGTCGGSGKVANPAAAVTDAVVGFANVFGGKKRKRLPRINAGPTTIPCTSCGGRGRVQQQIQCDRCNGAGQYYR